MRSCWNAAAFYSDLSVPGLFAWVALFLEGVVVLVGVGLLMLDWDIWLWCKLYFGKVRFIDCIGS